MRKASEALLRAQARRGSEALSLPSAAPKHPQRGLSSTVEMSEQPNSRVALVTGAASGIGRAIALAVAKDGCAVAVADLRQEAGAEVVRELEATGAEARSVAMDVTAGPSVTAAVERAGEELGPIAVLVNCAGWDELKPFLQTDEGFWRKVVAINYEGCLRVTHAVLGGMVQRGHGRIVSIASDAARVGSSGEAVYAGAKAGVVAFSKTIAREYARDGVTANVVCPGPTDTPLLQGMTEQAPDSERLITALSRAVPMRRLGQPQDVAAAVAFLASERAGYITGQTLSVSGGLTMA
ncbi:MAG TPA: SDR family oxidoreductase [Solirubrobacteraceae bacterium]|nr:SDR family oxidoreductase [Solirubrobacteraceae bacterium]